MATIHIANLGMSLRKEMMNRRLEAAFRSLKPWGMMRKEI
jgi:hypothetical protein